MTRGRQGWQQVALACLALTASCASPVSWQGGAPLAAPEQARARAHLLARPAPPGLFAANGTLLAYGRGERLRARVQLLVGASRKFRLTVLGPHNAAVWVVASDGECLRAYDAQQRALHAAPATREGLTQLAPGLDIGMPLQAWLSLLTFSLPVPADARAYARPHGQVAWTWTAHGAPADSGEGMQALADADGRVVAIRVPGADGGEVQASFLPAGRTGALPVAKEVDVRVADGQGKSVSTMSLSLEDIVADPALVSGVDPFVVGAP